MTGSTPYPNLFSPFVLGGLSLRNRVVMAPMSTELGGRDGTVTAEMIAFYRERALGGVGLIVVEFTCIEPATGRQNPHQLTLESEDNIDGHRRLVRALHHAGSKAFLQLQHSGQYANAALLAEGMPIAPSDLFARKDPARQIARAMRDDEIEHMVTSFANAAALGVAAGYDGIELHAAHGYLLTQFLSPFGNKRDDRWGGDFDRRLTFPVAVIRATKAAIGDRPLAYRLSADEFLKGGLTLEDLERIVPHLVEAGVDLLHVSTGWGVGNGMERVIEPMSMPEGWRIPYAARLRAAAGIPVITVGQIRDPHMAERAIADGHADLIALGRPMLADPAWANKAKAGAVDDIRPCTSCNWCIAPGREHVGCAENPRAGAELDPPLSSVDGAGRLAVVVGAGPGGAAAALMLDSAGFRTHLFEQRGQIGGGIRASATPPGKGRLFWYSDYLARRIAQSDVAVHLGEVATADRIRALSPDIVMLAAGTSPIDLPIDGIEHDTVLNAYDVLMGECDAGVGTGDHVVVYGGGETGCETAEFFAERGVAVTLVTRSPAASLARSADWIYRGGLLRRLHANPLISIRENSRVTTVGDIGVTIESEGIDGTSRTILAADRLLLAQGRRSENGLIDPLRAAGLTVSVIGDSRQMGRIGDAVQGAYHSVRSLLADYGRVEPAAC